MWIVSNKEMNFIITSMLDETPQGNIGLLVTVLSSYGESSKSLLDSSAIGKIIPLYYRGGVVCNVCYLPEASAEEVLFLDAKNTLFFTRDNGVTCAESIIKPLAVVLDSLMFQNPRDVINTVIVDSMIDHPDNVINYSVSSAVLAMTHTVVIKGVTVYRPVEGYPTLYRLIEEGRDVLNFTDLAIGDVVSVVYLDNTGLAVTEYTKVSSGKHLGVIADVAE